MLGNKMLNFINQSLQDIIGNPKTFSGISVIVVGDFKQLKHVFDGCIFKHLNHDYGPIARNLWTESFNVFSLIQIMRQKEDILNAQLLNHLRICNQTTDDISLLESRCIAWSFPSPDYPINAHHIFFTNDAVDTHNRMVFHMAGVNDEITVRYLGVVIVDRTESVGKTILKEFQTNVQ